MPAKALVLTIEMYWLYRPLRGQARSYAFGRSGFGVASAAGLNEQISMRRYSRGQKRVRRSLGGGSQRANPDAGLFSRADVDLASAANL